MASVGIDLGTTFSCVAVMRNGKVEIVPNRHGDRTTPSCVAFNKQERLVGKEAMHQMANNPVNTIYDVKRILGRKFQDPTVQADLKNWSFNVFGEDGKPKIKVQYEGRKRQFYPEEISSMVLERMKAIAEDFIGVRVNSVVITVPANFTNGQRRSTKEAAKIAELHVLKIINEPTAAAIAYGLERKTKSKRNVVVFDLGGGTFDVTALTIDDGCFKVLATGGDTHLGGQDFNERLLKHFLREFASKTMLDATESAKAMRRLMQECERAKRLLSFTERQKIEIDNFFGGKDLSMSISRARFEQLNEDLFRSTMETVETVLDDANLPKEKVHDVVLVGGSTRIPYVQELLADYFGKEKISNSINPDESVAHGAAVQAAMLSGDLTLELKALKLSDVTPLSLGVEKVGGVMSVIIKRNTEIPTKMRNTYCTASDYQKTITIKVFEGECTQTRLNHFLGAFTLSGLMPMPAGEAEVEECFEIDADGVLHVTARDLTRDGNEKRVKITWDKGRFSENEIERMVNDAKKMRRDDKIRAARK